METYEIRKRNKAERINNFIDSIFREERLGKYNLNRTVPNSILTNTEVEFYTRNSFERHKWSGSNDFNNPAIDVVIIGFKVIAEKLLFTFPKYKDEYSTVLDYLSKEERESILVGSGTLINLNDDIRLEKLDLRNNPYENYSEDELVNLSLLNHKIIDFRITTQHFDIKPLDEIMYPFCDLEDGVYEFNTNGILSGFRFAIMKNTIKVSEDRRSLLFMMEDEKVMEVKKLESDKEIYKKVSYEVYLIGMDTANIDEMYELAKLGRDHSYELSRVSSPLYNHMMKIRESLYEVLSYNESYFKKIKNDEEDPQFYTCSRCKDGGCPHCEPHLFINTNVD